MSRIYFDTEFEGLFENAGLISIGLTNESGSQTFYAELSDSYNIKNCSSFCKSVVLPLLQNDNTQMSLEELKVKLFTWLEQQGSNTTLICDSPRDIKQMNEIFSKGLPQNCRYQLLSFWNIWKRRIANYNRNLYTKYCLRDHHALDDAIVNRIIFEGK